MSRTVMSKLGLLLERRRRSTIRGLRVVLLTPALFVLTATTTAGEFTLEQILSTPFPSSLAGAAHAGRIAWIFDSRGARNIWIADAPGFRPRQLTRYTGDEGLPIVSVRLTPDGKTVLYARGSETNQQGEVADPTSNVSRPNQEVWAVDADGDDTPRLLGEMGCGNEGCEDIQISPDGRWAVWPARRQIWIAPVSGNSPAKALAYVRGDDREPRWSPDGRQVAFVSYRGDHSFIGVYDFSRQQVQWLAPSVDRDLTPRWSPDGREIAFIRMTGREPRLAMLKPRPEPWSIWMANVETGQARALWRSDTDLNGSFPRMTSDWNGAAFNFTNDYIVFASEQDGWRHLYRISVNGGEVRLLTPGDFDVEDSLFSAENRTMIYSSNQDDVDRRHIWKVAIEGGKPVALSSGTGSEFEPAIAGDGAYVVCFGSSGTSPKMPYVLGVSRRTMIAAEAIPKDFPAEQLVEPRQVVFKAPDSWTIHGQLFVPKGRVALGPALLFMHGGSRRQMILGFHYMQYYHNAYAENQYLANHGYVVLSVNYRTGTMYGRAFREVPDGGWRGASEYKDIVAAAQYLRMLPIVDPKRIGLWGGSYGGYLTALGLARNSDIFAAGVDMHGVHDWSARFDYPGPGGIATSGAPDAVEAKRTAFESSPVGSIDSWKSPVLLIQGDDDRNVAFSQMVDLTQLLRAHKVPYEQIVFPDEIHDFLLWRTWMRAYAATLEFFDRTLKQGEQIPAK